VGLALKALSTTFLNAGEISNSTYSLDISNHIPRNGGSGGIPRRRIEHFSKPAWQIYLCILLDLWVRDTYDEGNVSVCC